MRTYNIDGIEYISVTEIIGQIDKSDALKQWAVNVTLDYIKNNIFNIGSIEQVKYIHKDISNEAKEIGTEAHNIIEYCIKNNYFPPDYEMTNYYNETINCLEAFHTFYNDHNIEWLESELVVWNKEYLYAGTLDAIAIINGKKYIIDFKTSNAMRDGYDLQLAAYLYAYNKTNEKKINNCAVLRLDKNMGIYEFKDFTKDIERKFQAFLKQVDFFYLYKNRKIKNKRGSLK
jgi:hypothetical protein